MEADAAAYRQFLLIAASDFGSARPLQPYAPGFRSRRSLGRSVPEAARYAATVTDAREQELLKMLQLVAGRHGPDANPTRSIGGHRDGQQRRLAEGTPRWSSLNETGTALASCLVGVYCGAEPGDKLA
jgi:hypothetical protein